MRFLLALMVAMMADTLLAQAEPKTVYFDGNVDKANVDYTMKQLNPGDTLVINSRGGNLGEAQKMAEFVRANRVNTHVNSTGIAQSAAVLIFAAGNKRTSGKNAQFFIHMVKDKDMQESMDLTKFYADELRRYGVNEKVGQLPIINNTMVMSPELARHVGLVTD